MWGIQGQLHCKNTKLQCTLNTALNNAIFISLASAARGWSFWSTRNEAKVSGTICVRVLVPNAHCAWWCAMRTVGSQQIPILGVNLKIWWVSCSLWPKEKLPHLPSLFLLTKLVILNKKRVSLIVSQDLRSEGSQALAFGMPSLATHATSRSYCLFWESLA